jgi:hypothetical protein
MSSQGPTPRRRWPWMVVAIIIVVAIIVLLAVHFASSGTTPPPRPSSSPSASLSTPIADAAPTGCLGGSSRDASMVLSAEKLAPHTTNGAVDVAAAFVRWLNQYPYPAANTYSEIEKDGLAKSAPTRDLTTFFASNPNLSGGFVPDNTAYYASTVPGVYHVESATADTVSVSIGTGFVVSGALSPTLRGSITVTVHWERGSWKFVSSKGVRTTEDLYAIGTPFKAGC